MKNIKDRFLPDGYIFKLFPLFVALFVALQIECILFVYKQISIFYITTTLSGITFPINLLILAIVTHCYGKQSARQLIWINNIIILQFVAYNIFANFTSWSYVAENQKMISAYSELQPLFIRSGAISLVSENIAEFLFISLYNEYKNQKPISLNRWQNNIYEFLGLFKFSFIANFLMLVVSYSIIFWELSYSKILFLILQVMLVKSSIEIIFSPLAIYLILKIKKFEGFAVNDFSGNNPFLFMMDHKYLNFNMISDDEDSSN